MADTTSTVEPLEAQIIIGDSEEVYLDEETTATVRAFMVKKLAEELNSLNYTALQGTGSHEAARELLWAAERVQKYADVIYWLTPVPDEEVDAP